MLQTFTTNHPLMAVFKKKIYKENDEAFGDYRDWEYDEYETILQAFFEMDKFICLLQEGEIVAATTIHSIEEEMLPIERLLFKQFEGIIYKVHSLNKEETEEGYTTAFLEAFAREYPHIVLYTYHVDHQVYAPHYTYTRVNSSITGERIVLDDEYAISKHAMISVKETLYQLQQPKQIKEVVVYRFQPGKEEDEYNLKELFKHSFCIINKSNHLYYDGLDYAKPSDFSYYRLDANLVVFVAVAVFEDGSKQPIGVLKIADYELSNEKNYIGLNYVTVHQSYRRKGIAVKLYEALNEYLGELKESGEEVVFIASSLSEQGKQARINEVRKRIVTNCLTFDDREEYMEHIRSSAR